MLGCTIQTNDPGKPGHLFRESPGDPKSSPGIPFTLLFGRVALILRYTARKIPHKENRHNNNENNGKETKQPNRGRKQFQQHGKVPPSKIYESDGLIDLA